MKDSSRAMVLVGLFTLVASLMGAAVILAHGGPDGGTEVSLFWSAVLFLFNYPIMASGITLVTALTVVVVKTDRGW